MDDIHALIRYKGIEVIHTHLEMVFAQDFKRMRTHHINHVFDRTLLTYILSQVALYAPSTVYNMLQVCKLWLGLTYDKAFWKPLITYSYARLVHTTSWPKEVKECFLVADILTEWRRRDMAWLFKRRGCNMTRSILQEESTKTWYGIQLKNSEWSHDGKCTCKTPAQHVSVYNGLLIRYGSHFKQHIVLYYGDTTRDTHRQGNGKQYLVNLHNGNVSKISSGTWCCDSRIGKHHITKRGFDQVHVDATLMYHDNTLLSVIAFIYTTPTTIYEGPAVCIDEFYIMHATESKPCKITYRDSGDVYRGPAVDGLPHGKGTLTSGDTGRVREVTYFAGVLQYESDVSTKRRKTTTDKVE